MFHLENYVMSEKNLDDMGINIVMMKDTDAFCHHMQKLKESNLTCIIIICECI